MESFEEQVHKELKSKNINNKNYLWVITFVLLVSLITYYSYKNQMGVIGKQTINKEFMVKNQENLQQLYKENLNNPERRYLAENKPKSLYDAEIIVQNDAPVHDDISEEDPTSTLDEGPEVNVNDEQIAQDDIPLTSPDVQQDVAMQIQEVKTPKKSVTVAKVEPKMVAAPTPPVVVEAIKKQSIQPAKINKADAPEVAYVYEPKKEFDIIKCYNLQSNEADLTLICKDKISDFLQAHKSASKFEVIGVIDLIDEKDVIKHNHYKNVYYLGEARIKKAKALIQQRLGKQVSILEHEYTLKTELENRGVIIRAYN